MTINFGKTYKMTKKTRLFLWLYNIFDDVAQWFLDHCDYEDTSNGVKT